jgi:L-ascorbate metabolism protein UlaG (beta-lactamase superfamily)
MRITKYTHAYVRLEQGGGALVIDPGIWTEARAVTGADAILVTHEHSDHLDIRRFAGLGIQIYGPADADLPGVDWTRLTSGEEFGIAGFTVRAVGARHAFVYDGSPDCANLGYIIDDACYHPGDSLHVPDQPIDTLFVPAQGSWLKTSEVIDFIQAIRPQRALPIHDGQVNERGLGSINSWLAHAAGDGYRYLAPGETA